MIGSYTHGRDQYTAGQKEVRSMGIWINSPSRDQQIGRSDVLVHHCAFKKRSFNGQNCRPLTPLHGPSIPKKWRGANSHSARDLRGWFMPPSCGPSVLLWPSSSCLVSWRVPLTRPFAPSQYPLDSVWRRPSKRRRGWRWIADTPNPAG